MNAPQPKTQNQKAAKSAISPTRGENYAEWYQQVVRAADMAEMSGVRGCMVIKPWGYGAWELMQRELDARFKETGHENCYFPIFIPLSYFQREANHVEGFAKEMAVVTHHRLKVKDGVLAVDPDAALEEPLIVRPTSETVIGEAMAKWIKSYRDLPLLINQWANVVRWEMRPRILLRTAEFLWQEGHTAHETEADAMRETKQMLEVYRAFAEDFLAVPVIAGEKTPAERFPGAVTTYSIEAMMQDGRALQAGTSHYLGENFARSIGIQYQNRAGGLDFVHTTSWGASTRLLGALLMTHADDDGMKMPPRVAPWQIVISPILRDDADKQKVMDYCESLKATLQTQIYAGAPLRVKLDARDISGADKKWEWIKKGAPLLLEIGPRDVGEGKVCVTRRDELAEGKKFLAREELVAGAVAQLGAIQKNLFDQAAAYRAARTVEIKTKAEFEAYFAKDADNSFMGGQGFVRAKLASETPELTAWLDKMGVTIRCLPLEQNGAAGKCIFSGAGATQDAIFARAY